MAEEFTGEMRDLLIRLDEKVQNGFASITAKLDSMDRRADGHETRLHAMEMELADRQAYKSRFHAAEDDIEQHGKRLDQIETTAKTTGKLAAVLWTVASGGGLVAAFEIAKAVIH